LTVSASTLSPVTIASSIDVFELILKNFKTFEGYKFNVKNAEDAPTVPKMKYSYADLLYAVAQSDNLTHYYVQYAIPPSVPGGPASFANPVAVAAEDLTERVRVAGAMCREQLTVRQLEQVVQARHDGALS